MLEWLTGSNAPSMGRKDLVMRHMRRFTPEFKRHVVEELLSGVSTPAQIIRRYEISSSLLYHWKRQYARGGFDNAPNREVALEERIRQLEQLVGKLTLENEFLKKAVQRSLAPEKKKADSLSAICTLSRPSKGGANS